MTNFFNATEYETLHKRFARAMNSPILNKGPMSHETSSPVGARFEQILIFAEASGTLIYDLRRTTDVMGAAISFGSFFRSVTGASVTGSLANTFLKLAEELEGQFPFWQSSSWIDVLDDFHKNIHRVSGSVLGKKIISVFNHVIAHTFYHKLNLKVDEKTFRHIEKGYITPTIWNVLSFIDVLAGLLLFLAKAGRQAIQTGNVDAFFIDGTMVADWTLRCSRLRKEAEFLGNPKAVGMSAPIYIKSVKEAIEDGERLKRITKSYEKTIVDTIIIELELILKRIQSSIAAASIRWCPIGIFVQSDDSGTGKSFITTGLFNWYITVRREHQNYDWINNDRKPELYPRNPNDPFYSLFRSDIEGMLFDDVGQHKASKVLGVDQTIGDLISVINNIPMLTNQAVLEDKGKIPVLVEWVGVTSNIRDLNVHAYYNNTYAVLRRLEYRIEPIVKKAFRKPDSSRLDPSLVPPGELYPDCWTFKVCRAKQHPTDKLHGTYDEENPDTFGSYAELLLWLRRIYENHIDEQTKLLATIDSAGPERMCKCRLPVSLCACNSKPDYILDLHIDLGKIEPTAQAGTGPAITRYIDERRKLVQSVRSSPALEQLYLESRLIAEFDPMMTRSLRGDTEVTTPENLAEEITEMLTKFRELSPRDKICTVAGAQGNIMIARDDEYLSFTPKTGGKRNIIRSQLRWVHDYVLKYVRHADWTQPQLAALEAFIYTNVPRYLANGWDDDSILQAAFDYVDAYARHYDKPWEVKEMLLEPDLPGETWRDAMCRKLGMLYFTNNWFRSTVNYVGGTRVGSYLGTLVVQSPQSQVRTMCERAQLYDDLLGGSKSFVLIVISVCTASAILVAIKVIFDRFRPQAQLSLEAIGIKPKVRKEDKPNVWVTPERNITKLDFHPKKPNSLVQMMPAIQFNSLRADFVKHGFAKGTTNILVVDNETLVINNHSCFDGMTLTIFLNPKKPTGIQASVVVEICEEMVRRIPERDIAIVTTMALPALFKDISSYMPATSYSSVGKSFYYLPQDGQSAKEVPVVGVRQVQLSRFVGEQGKTDMLSWSGRPQTPTVPGDCGAPLIVETPYGPVLAGIHCAYSPEGVSFAAPIFHSDFNFKPMVQVGQLTPAVPVLVEPIGQVKLYTDYYEEGTLMTFGALTGFRPRPTASGEYTPYAKDVQALGKEMDLRIEDRLTRPDMGSWEPQQNILKEYLHPTHSMREPIFRAACEGFSKHIRQNLTNEDREDGHPVPVSVAVNGFPEVPNVDAQKFTTSAGHGFPGSKKTYVVKDEAFQEWDRYREYSPEVMAEVERIHSLASRGVRSHPIFTAQLKDEMISQAKRAAKKTRGFYMCPLPFLTVMRMYTLGLTRVMVRRRNLFRHAVGLNTHSEAWNELFEEAKRFFGDQWLAGDFRGFDKILSILIQNGGKYIFLDLAKECGFDDVQLLILDTLLSDNVTAAIDFFGTLIVLLGGEVSGHQVTTFFNSICNILLHMYAFIVLGDHFEPGRAYAEWADDFFTNVFIRVLGDDIMAKVALMCAWYNHTNIQFVFSKIGIEYTMADKSSESRPFISWDEVTFLKRSFRDHEAFPGLKVAPLEKDSIYKMLLYTTRSKTTSPEEQLSMSMCAAASEAFYHGREFYEKIMRIIREIPKSPELEARCQMFPPPSWDTLFSRFMTASPNYARERGWVPPAEPGASSETAQDPDSSDCHISVPHAQSSWRVDCWGSTTMEDDSEELRGAGIRLSPNKRTRCRRKEKSDSIETKYLSKQQTQTTHTTNTVHGEMASTVIAKAINKQFSKERRRKKKQQWQCAPVAQADVQYESTSDTQQLYAFPAEPTTKSVDMRAQRSSIATKMSTHNTLGEYFSRPRLISTFTWTEAMSTGVQATLNPWNAFLANASYKEKMSGFGLFRGNLHLKFTVNGSPFYYGGLMAAYTPLSGVRTDTAGSIVNLALVAHSQKPHVWLNVQNMSTADMVVPFLYPYPFAETTAVTYTNLGKIDMVVYSPLRSANGVTGSAVDIQVFAWMEDIELAGPTNLPVSQSNIEYKKDGPISSTASVVAAAAGSLSEVPIIGPFATATSEMANKIGAAASIFGFTNVPNISDVNPVMQVPFTLASTETSVPIQKLSLEPKQETSVGSVQHGGQSHDELVVSRFAGRQSFLVGSLWTTTSVPGDILFSSFVTPNQWQTNGTTAQAFLPMGYLAQMMQYWRGSIEITVKMIRSKYHRGRIQLSWDRNASSLAQGATLGNTNTMSTIMDLDETDEVTFRVPYVQPQQFLSTTTVGPGSSVMWDTSVSPTMTIAQGLTNGVFNIRVLNRLTAPEATSDVTLLIFMKGGPDIEFAGPRNLYSPNGTAFTTLSSLSVGVAQSAIVYEEDSLEAESEAALVSPMVYKEVFGEKLNSLRSYLHRSSLAKAYGFGLKGDFYSRQIIPLKRLPVNPGVWNNGIENVLISAASQKANVCPQHPITWLTNCFIGYKGSVNITANVRLGPGANNSGYVDYLAIDRVPDGAGLSAGQRIPYRQTQDYSTSTTNYAAQFFNQMRPGTSGKSMTNTRTNTSITANLPYYNNAGFMIADMYTTYNNTDSFSGANNDWWELSVLAQGSNTNMSDSLNAVDVFYGTGPDFDVVFFINVPIVYTRSYT